MNLHALTILEFPRVLALVAERAQSGLGAERVRELTPSQSIDEIGTEHRRVRAVRSLLAAEDPWRPENIADARSALARLVVASSGFVILRRFLFTPACLAPLGRWR